MSEIQTHAMNIAEIKRYLPHRYPMLLVDRVLEITKGETISCIKNVSYNENIFQGHFPNRPILPGVVIIEALAQASGILGFHAVGKTAEDGLLYLFAGIDDVRFKRPVVPGDQLLLESRIIYRKRNIWKFEVEASVDGELATSGLLTCAITEQ